MNYFFKSIIYIATIFFILSCSDSNTSINNKKNGSFKDEILLKGYYLDSIVQGLKYKCGSNEGFTNSKGEFNFKEGDSCKFYIGDIIIRYVDSSKLFNGVYILENSGLVAAILQTSDIDGNPNNGIKLSKYLPSCIAKSIEDIDLEDLKSV